MTRALGPTGGSLRQAALPFTILGLCWVPIAALGAVWTGGRTASLLTGHGGQGPQFGWDFARALTARGGLGTVWPATSQALIWTCTALVVVVALVPIVAVVVTVLRRQSRPGDPLPSLASGRELQALIGPVAVRRARQLRPSLSEHPERDVAAADVGVPLGRLQGSRPGEEGLRASWEDVLLAVMAPRAGKTTALAVPAILDAPGAVVATSNKADLWMATAEPRATATGERVWVFDPQRIVYADRTWWWNPLRDVTTVEEAYRLAGHFVQEVRPERGDRDFWTAAAHDLLTGLLLAAASSGRDLVEVYEWLNDPVLATPVELLRAAGHRAAAASLQGRMHGAPETRDGVYETARTAAQCLRDEAIMAWVTPPASRHEHLDELDAAAFAASRKPSTCCPRTVPAPRLLW